MNKNFYPSINGIYFKNFDIVQDSNHIKHIRGDIYSKGNVISMSSDTPNEICIGYYNPVYQTEENESLQYFLRLEEDFHFLYETEGKYESLFNKKAIPLAEYDCPVGFRELISDLEIVTYLYEFMRNICPTTDFSTIGLVGIINGASETPKMNVVQIKDPDVTTDSQIITFINDKIESIHLDPEYPTLIFKCEQDFTLWYVNGKKIDIIESENV